ncbi:protein angel isoform X1 [Zeugodacus cucurbitae]|uniref:protein angel isoform X1 n=1 Tax=Zeugodacus cucurbitae TaxID=28588 RepID=UPI0023D94E56|nr:protein angel isoform X1 [Zeugodacus cucurbitae]
MSKILISTLNSNQLFNAIKPFGNIFEQVWHFQAQSISRWTFANKMGRRWERVKSEAETSIGNSKTFTLLSYNILAQDLLAEHLHLYIGIEPSMLRWDHRLFRLREEIQYVKPDILCLQEMQFNHLKNLVKHISFKRELEYVFKKKTGHRTDGCAIIYDKSKFRLLSERPVEYYTHGDAVLNRDNIALLAKFAIRKEPQKKFIIATTHLLYNPRRQDVRIAQVEKLLGAIQQYSAENEGKNSAFLPVILTGDFNFEPKTRPYQLLCEPCKAKPISQNFVKSPNLVAADSQQQTSREYYLKAPDEDGNELQMMPLDFGIQTASTFQDQWITVDYVLHSVDKNRKKMQIQSVYALPKINDCVRTGSIPNKYLGSDHYSLGIKFSVL